MSQGIAPKLEFSTTSVITECLISSRKWRTQVKMFKLLNDRVVHGCGCMTGLIPISPAFLLTSPISLWLKVTKYPTVWLHLSKQESSKLRPMVEGTTICLLGYLSYVVQFLKQAVVKLPERGRDQELPEETHLETSMYFTGVIGDCREVKDTFKRM